MQTALNQHKVTASQILQEPPSEQKVLAQRIQITIVEVADQSNPVMREIQESINTYLLRNKNDVSDFNLIKDIVERYTDGVGERHQPVYKRSALSGPGRNHARHCNWTLQSI